MAGVRWTHFLRFLGKRSSLARLVCGVQKLSTHPLFYRPAGLSCPLPTWPALPAAHPPIPWGSAPVTRTGLRKLCYSVSNA